MSEVKRFRADHRHVVETEFDDAQFVDVADFGRVTAERDALQALLTAADERADVLEGWLRRWSTEAGGIFCALKYETDAALKPAEGRGDEQG